MSPESFVAFASSSHPGLSHCGPDWSPGISGITPNYKSFQIGFQRGSLRCPSRLQPFSVSFKFHQRFDFTEGSVLAQADLVSATPLKTKETFGAVAGGFSAASDRTKEHDGGATKY